MSHEDFIQNISLRLSKLIQSDPFLSHLKSYPNPKTPTEQEKSLISLTIRRFDNSLINVNVSEDARLFELKRSIKQKFSNKKINWKFIWKKYSLETSDHQQLINDNQKIKAYGVINNTQLFFVRRCRIK